MKFEQNGQAAATSSKDSNDVTICEHFIWSQMCPINVPIYVAKYLVEGELSSLKRTATQILNVVWYFRTRVVKMLHWMLILFLFVPISHYYFFIPHYFFYFSLFLFQDMDSGVVRIIQQWLSLTKPFIENSGEISICNRPVHTTEGSAKSS